MKLNLSPAGNVSSRMSKAATGAFPLTIFTSLLAVSVSPVANIVVQVTVYVPASRYVNVGFVPCASGVVEPGADHVQSVALKAAIALRLKGRPSRCVLSSSTMVMVGLRGLVENIPSSSLVSHVPIECGIACFPPAQSRNRILPFTFMVSMGM